MTRIPIYGMSERRSRPFNLQCSRARCAQTSILRILSLACRAVIMGSAGTASKRMRSRSWKSTGSRSCVRVVLRTALENNLEVSRVCPCSSCRVKNPSVRKLSPVPSLSISESPNAISGFLRNWSYLVSQSFSTAESTRLLSSRSRRRTLTATLIRCKRSAFVDRPEYQESRILACPLPGCNYAWCKSCQMAIDFGGPPHSCDGSSEFRHLMKEKGWKHCPGEPSCPPTQFAC